MTKQSELNWDLTSEDSELIGKIVVGISHMINKDTGKLPEGFVPRYSINQ